MSVHTTHPIRPRSAFTLLEIIVVLLIIFFTTTLLFGAYIKHAQKRKNIGQEQKVAPAQLIDRSTMKRSAPSDSSATPTPVSGGAAPSMRATIPERPPGPTPATPIPVTSPQ